jgi:glycosyltransferase involved in cell wall biosynthesis
VHAVTAVKPLVTAVMPAYNAERFVEQAITSILGQTYSPVECVVVNDGSTDGTAAVIDRLARLAPDRVRCLHTDNHGVASARNTALRAARGEYVAFLDADDLWMPDKLARQVEALQGCPSVGMVYTGLHLVDEEGRFIGRMRPASPEVGLRNTLLMERPVMSLMSALVRRDVLDRVGLFDPRLSTSADCDLVCRIALSHRVLALRDALYLWRLHGGGMHLNPGATEHDMRIVFGKLFENERLPDELRALRARAYGNLFVTLAGAHLHAGDRRKFLQYAARAALVHPARIVAAGQRLTRPGGPEGLPTVPS